MKAKCTTWAWSELLKHNRQKDLMLQRTSGGIHRDDLLFQLGEQPFKNIASQGQRKSLLFALKAGGNGNTERRKTPLSSFAIG